MDMRINHRRPHPHGGKTNFTVTVFVSPETLIEMCKISGRQWCYDEHSESVGWRSKSGKCYNAICDVSKTWRASGQKPRARIYQCMDVEKINNTVIYHR